MNTHPWNRKLFRVKEPTSVIHPQTLSAGSNSADNVKGQLVSPIMYQNKKQFQAPIRSFQVTICCEMHKRNVVLKFCATPGGVDRYLSGFPMKISDRHPYHLYIRRPPLPGLQHNCMYEKNNKSARLGTTWLPLKTHQF